MQIWQQDGGKREPSLWWWLFVVQQCGCLQNQSQEWWDPYLIVFLIPKTQGEIGYKPYIWAPLEAGSEWCCDGGVTITYLTQFVPFAWCVLLITGWYCEWSSSLNFALTVIMAENQILGPNMEVSQSGRKKRFHDRTVTMFWKNDTRFERVWKCFSFPAVRSGLWRHGSYRLSFWDTFMSPKVLYKEATSDKR